MKSVASVDSEVMDEVVVDRVAQTDGSRQLTCSPRETVSD
jgi:hypothetical protein